jgi:hypothetical protein
MLRVRNAIFYIVNPVVQKESARRAVAMQINRKSKLLKIQTEN